MAVTVEENIVLAAGLVVWRTTSKDIEVLMIRRTVLKDWVLPKGHLDGDESAPEAACREFEEETGYKAVARQPIAVIDYPVGKSIKRVY